MQLTIAMVYLFVVYILYKLLDRLIRIPKITDKTDRYILVTGCDTGFGHDVAKRLDGIGCHVFATCLTDSGESELKKQCSDRLRTLHVDLTKTETIQNAFEKVKHSLPRDKGLWAILNNAGVIGKIAPDEWLHLTDYQKVLDVNLLGHIGITMTFLPLLKSHGGGRIVNTSSMAGRYAWPQTSAYCISKYGIECFSDSLRWQMRPYNVSVHLIEPSPSQTAMTDVVSLEKSVRQAWRESTQATKDEYGESYLEAMIEQGKQGSVYIPSRNSDVVDAYEHALLGRYPRARYIIGMEAKLLICLTSLMPEWFIDWLWDKLIGTMQPKAVSDGRYLVKQLTRK